MLEQTHQQTPEQNTSTRHTINTRSPPSGIQYTPEQKHQHTPPGLQSSSTSPPGIQYTPGQKVQPSVGATSPARDQDFGNQDSSTPEQKAQPSAAGLHYTPEQKVQLSAAGFHHTPEQKVQLSAAGFHHTPEQKVQLSAAGFHHTLEQKPQHKVVMSNNAAMSGDSDLTHMLTSDVDRLAVAVGPRGGVIQQIEQEDEEDVQLSDDEDDDDEDADADARDEDVDDEDADLLPGDRTLEQQQRFEDKFKELMRQVRLARIGGFEAVLRHWTRADNLQRRSRTYRRRIATVQAVLSREQLVSIKQVRSELKKLVGKPFFDNYLPENSMKQVDLSQINDIIRVFAPTWYRMVNDDLLPNNRHNWQDVKDRFKNKYDLVAKRSVMITTTVVHSIAKKRANWMPKALGLLLVTGGVKSRLISILNRAGLVSGFKTLQALQELNADEHMRALVEMARDPQVLIAYDNFCRQEQKNEQIVGQKTEQKNMTTSLIAKCKYIPNNINKGMVGWETPLSAMSILRSLANKDTVGEIIARGKQSAKHLALQTSPTFGTEQPPDLQYAHAATVEDEPEDDATDGTDPAVLAMTPDHATALYHIDQSIADAIGNEVLDMLFEDGSDSRPQWPVIDELIHELTEVLSLPVSMNDEASLKGTYAVHKDIWLHFLKFAKEDFKATKDGRLWLVHGDQMTIERARSVMKEMVESELSFDKKDWMLPIPAWFHIKMNNLWTVAVRTHWDLNKEGERLDHSLTADNRFFGIKQITNKNPKFFRTQSLVIRGFKARNLGLFVQELKDRKKYARQGDESEIDALRRTVATIGKTLYLEVLESIYTNAYTARAWKGTIGNNPTVNDPVFTTQCRMLQEVELFMTIAKAIRMEDIGHMRRLVDRLIILFLGAGQSNYGREMIYLRWLLSEAVDERLQTGILASSVLNQSGSRGKAVSTDELVEIYNMEYSMDIKQHANSTHTLDKTFRRIALMRECSRVLKLMFGGFGATYTNYHTAKDTSDDIVGFSMQLQEKGLSAIKPRRTGALSDDIYQAGVNLLLSKVGDFNTANQLFARGITTVAPNFDDGEAEDFGEHGPAAAEDGDEAFVAAGGGGDNEIEEEVDIEDNIDRVVRGAGVASSEFA